MKNQVEKNKLKTDQQIILPPYQKMGLGSHLLFITL